MHCFHYYWATHYFYCYWVLVGFTDIWFISLSGKVYHPMCFENT